MGRNSFSSSQVPNDGHGRSTERPPRIPPRRSLGLNGTQPAPGRKNSHHVTKRDRAAPPLEPCSSVIPSTTRAGIPAVRSTATHAAATSCELPVPVFIDAHAPFTTSPRGNPFSIRIPSASTAV